MHLDHIHFLVLHRPQTSTRVLVIKMVWGRSTDHGYQHNPWSWIRAFLHGQHCPNPDNELFSILNILLSLRAREFVSLGSVFQDRVCVISQCCIPCWPYSAATCFPVHCSLLQHLSLLFCLYLIVTSKVGVFVKLIRTRVTCVEVLLPLTTASIRLACRHGIFFLNDRCEGSAYDERCLLWAGGSELYKNVRRAIQ